MALPTIEIMKKAEHLAARLNSGPSPVKKNVLLGLVSDFMNEPEPDVQRLRHLLELIEQGSGGHIRRGAGYGEQLRAAVREIRKALDERGLDGKDFKSLFGWTARLLLVRSAPREARRPGPPPPGKPDRREPPSTPPRAPVKLGSINAKGISDLEKLRQKIQDKEEGGED
jgi:hypothetical protein